MAEDSDLTKRRCQPCEGWMKPLTVKQYTPLLRQLTDWRIESYTHLKKTFKFKNFSEALKFVQLVGQLAEKEGHHPDLSLHNWNKVTILLTTHAIRGLSTNDFILAAKIDQIAVLF